MFDLMAAVFVLSPRRTGLVMDFFPIFLFIALFAVGFCLGGQYSTNEADWPNDDVYTDCDNTRRCFGVPAGCLPTKTCSQLVTYRAADKDGRIPVELYGNAPNSTYADNFWIGFAASSTGQMDFSAVVQCAHYSNGSNDVVGAYNGDESYNALPDPRMGIYNVRHTFLNGFVRCSFDLDVKRTVMNQTFDLTTPYSVLLGSGWISETRQNTYKLEIHVKTPFISPEKVIFSCGNKCPMIGDAYDGCGTTRKCFGVPQDCLDSKKCKNLIAYTEVDQNGRIPFELYGQAPNITYANNFWVGFGASKSGQMGLSAVVQCVHYSNGSNDVVAAYNGVGAYNVLPDPRLGVYNVTHSFLDGFVRCTFDLDVKRTVMGDAFDLTTPYSLLLGSGWINETSPNQYQLMKHVNVPLISPDKVVFSCGNNCPPPFSSSPAPPSSTTARPDSPPNGQFGFPKGCESNNKKCKVLVTYGLSSTNASRVAFTLRGVKDDGDDDGQFYAAVALAPTSKMSHAYVMECVAWKDEKSARQDLFASYNAGGHKNTRIASTGLYPVTSALNDGALQCNFESDLVHKIDDSLLGLSDDNTFDLKEKYYLLLAIGKVRSGTSEKKEHSQTAHTPNKVNVTEGRSVDADNSEVIMKKTHAILMVIAWNFFVGCGIMIARHTKDMWPDHQPFGTKVWFLAHRTVMTLAAVLSIISITLIFVTKGEWADIPHAYVGIVTFGLAMIQPGIALFRPHPGTPKRPYFNYFHWTVGYSTQILAGVAIFLGIRLETLGVPRFASYIFIACAGAAALAQFALEGYKFSQRSKIYKSGSKENLTEDDDSQMTSFSSTLSQTGLSPHDRIRQALLTISAFILLGGTAAIVTLIILA